MWRLSQCDRAVDKTLKGAFLKKADRYKFPGERAPVEEDKWLMRSARHGVGHTGRDDYGNRCNQNLRWQHTDVLMDRGRGVGESRTRESHSAYEQLSKLMGDVSVRQRS